MKKFNLKDYIGGWFIGSFLPNIISTDKFEIAIKHYNVGQNETAHYHKIADEITVIVKGSAMMNGVIYNENDILYINKGEATDFIPLTDTITCVVKIPSVLGDKYVNNKP